MRMKKFNLTPRVKKILENAEKEAQLRNHERVNSAHLFNAIFTIDYLAFDIIFGKVQYKKLADEIIPFVQENHPEFFKRKNKQTLWHNEVQEIIKFANETSTTLNQEYIGIEHLLYSILMTSPTVRGFLDHKKIDHESISDSLINYLKNGHVFPKQGLEQKPKSLETPTLDDDDASPQTKGKFIEKYCTNFTDLALNNKIVNVFGREKEIQAITETILRKTKNNIVLVGDPGVGKTAIVEGLASKIASDEVSYLLAGRIVVSLNVASMVAGTKYRGQFEQRFEGLLNELKKDKRYILFIDEIHTIIGAGSGEGSLDVANMIKPALARGEICCIGATTQSEYKKYFEKDGALKRRFEMISIDEPTKEQTKQIIMSAKSSFEDYHGVVFSEQIVDNLIYLCDKYLPYRKFPDKAFDMLDFTSSRVKIKNFHMPKNILSLEKKIKKTLEKIDQPSMQDVCNQLIISYGEKIKKWADKDLKTIDIVNEDLISVFAEKLKIDPSKIVLGENIEAELIGETLKKHVFGQDEAINKISDILTCAKVGLKDKNKPIGKFLFIGPTGVGKTWTAKLLAEKFLGNDRLLLKLDMSEYQESSTVNKLIGSTIGYVGCDEGGILTEFVRNNPSCVVLFDEIEKAHRDIYNLLLQIMDDGYITDSLGRRIDFTNSIIILTGNIGQGAKPKTTMGFMSSTDSTENVYAEEVKKVFRPEFLARVDETIVFQPIANKEFNKILQTLIANTKQLLGEQGKSIEVDQSIFDNLLKIIEKEGNNARSIKNIYRKHFEIDLAKFISQNKLSKISAKMLNNDVKFEGS